MKNSGLKISAAIFMLFLPLLAQNPVGVKAYAVKPMVDVYEKTFRGFDVVAELRYREAVELLSESGKWSYIKYAGKYKGWVETQYISLTKPPEIVDIYKQAFTSHTKWFPSPYIVIGWEKARLEVGELRTVEGNVERVVVSPDYYYLYLDPVGEKFRAVISVKDVDEFPYPLETFYLYRQVRVSGLLKYTAKGAEMVLIAPKQIQRAYSSAPEDRKRK